MMSKSSGVIFAITAVFVGGFQFRLLADELQVQQVVPFEIFGVDVEEADEMEEVPVARKAGAAVILQQLVAPLFGTPDRKVDPKAMEAQVQQWVGQFTQQYKPLLWTELNFIRLNCDLTPEQRPQVKAAGDAVLKDICRKMAERQVRPNAGNQAQIEPRKAIRKALREALEKTLSADAMRKFNEEVEQRAARRKEAAILSVVARMDTALYLTEEQRTAIEKSLTAAWQEDWEQWLFLHIYGDQYFPMVPDQHVVAHLNKDQKAVWNTLQKVNFGYWGGGAQADDAAWWGDKSDPADEAAGAVIFEVAPAVVGEIIVDE